MTADLALRAAFSTDCRHRFWLSRDAAPRTYPLDAHGRPR